MVVREVVHVAPLLVQPVHWKPVGDCEQFAVSTIVVPTIGELLLALSVHTGAAVGGCCQLIETLAGGLMPEALVAVTA